jgi:uncharacterized protein YhfF
MRVAEASVEVRAFWTGFVAHLGHDPGERLLDVFHFDDNQPSADELADLVLAGRKRATASLVWAYEAEGQRMPQPGDLSIVTRFSGEPVCVIETRHVEVVPFRAVDAEFAATEGEGDGSLAHWRRVHDAFFRRECARFGREFHEDASVVCEEFAVVYA